MPLDAAQNGSAGTHGKDLTYEKKGAVADTKGQDFEVALCTLLHLRGLRKCADFYLASNHGKAGSFDDVVLIYRLDVNQNYRAVLLQAKHKRNAEIGLKAFLGIKNDFSLSKYFKSYMEMKKYWQSVIIMGEELMINDVTYVLYTNALANLEGASIDVTQSESYQQLSGLLLTGGKMVQLSHDHVSAVFSDAECSHNKEFLQHFVLCYGQMDCSTACTYLDEEISYIVGSEQDKSKIRETLTRLIKDWWEKPVGVSYLTKDSEVCKSIVDAEIDRLNSKIKDKFFRFSLCFTQSCLKSYHSLMETTKQLLLIVSDAHEADLVSMKLYQALMGRIVVLSSKDLEAHLEDVLRVWKTSFCDILVINAFSWLNKDTLNSLKTIVLGSTTKRLIIVTKSLQERDDWYVRQDRSYLEDLETNCCMDLLRCYINLQGVRMSLGEYDPSITNILHAGHILHLAEKPTEILLGQKVAKPVAYYVPRLLQRKTCVAESFFDSVRGQTTVIGIVGIGKENIKQKFNDRFNIYSYEDTLELDSVDFCCIVTLSLDTYEIQFFDLCQKYECETYLFLHQKDDFLYLQSKNGLDHVRKHLKDKVSESVKCIWNMNERNVVIDGFPGIGKSSFISWMNCKVKKAHSKIWIVRIDIGRYTDALSKRHFTSVEEVLEFLEEVSLTNEDISGLQKSLFRHALNVTGNIMIALDGFDEISPDYTDKCLRLLNVLNKSLKYAKLVVTTRPVTRKIVEDALDVLALTLPCFSEYEVVSFFQNYCSSSNIAVSDHRISEIIQCIGRCLEVPLLAFMAAEGLLDDTTRLEQYINLQGRVKLYDMFVERQIKVFLTEKHGFSSSTAYHREILESMKESISEKLMVLAATTLFNNEEINKIGLKGIDKDLRFSKVGLIVSVGERVDFVHRTFTEFFLGMWFGKKFRECRDIIEEKLFGVNFEFVRESFNNFLYRGCALHSAVAEGDLDATQKLLSEGVSSCSTDEGGRTPLHVAVMSKVNDSALWSLLTNAGAAMNQRDSVLSWPAITYAEAVSNWKAVEFLLGKGDSREELKLVRDKEIAKSVIKESSGDGLLKLSMLILEMHGDLLNEGLDWSDNTVLHCAAASGFVPLVSELINKRVTMNTLNAQGRTAMGVAAEKGHAKVVTILHRAGASTEAGHYTPLILAMTQGHAQVIRYLMYGGDCEDREHALLKAAISNQPSILQALLNEGVDINHRDSRGFSALHWASLFGHFEMTKLLLLKEAELEGVNNNGTTALLLASMNGHKSTVNTLLNAGANVQSANNNGNTALLWGSRNGHVETVHLLLTKGAEVNKANDKGNTALLLAAGNGHTDTVKLLLDKGANVNSVDIEGNTALMLASEKGHFDILNVLLTKGANVNMANKKGSTALHFAGGNGRIDMLELLLCHDADVDVTDSEGNTAMILASTNAHSDAQQILINVGTYSDEQKRKLISSNDINK